MSIGPEHKNEKFERNIGGNLMFGHEIFGCAGELNDFCIFLKSGVFVVYCLMASSYVALLWSACGAIC